MPRALLLSAAIHLLFAGALTPDSPGGRTPFRAVEILSVRLVSQPAAARQITIQLEPENVPALPRIQRSVRGSGGRTAAISVDTGARPAREVESPALPQVPDPTYYDARDLDVYPRLIAPLALDRIAASGTLRMQVAVAVRIDEQGSVNEVAFPEPAAPDRLREELRALLAATRFVPALKDGRAVKSRVLLSVDFAPERREQ